MSPSPAPRTVIADVPVTLRITVAFPDGAPADRRAAEAVAACAAEHFAHVGHARISAFNEVNRVHPQAAGTVEAVSSSIDTPRKAAA